jgi:hypothetical protein
VIRRTSDVHDQSERALARGIALAEAFIDARMRREREPAMNTPDRKMYKILCPMERNGRKWWMSLGMGFTNRDASINLHLDAVPVGQTNLVLQLREYTEEDMRQSAERRATFSANRGSASGYTNHSTTRHAPANDTRNSTAPGATGMPLGGVEIDFHPGAEPLAPQSVPF